MTLVYVKRFSETCHINSPILWDHFPIRTCFPVVQCTLQWSQSRPVIPHTRQKPCSNSLRMLGIERNGAETGARRRVHWACSREGRCVQGEGAISVALLLPVSPPWAASLSFSFRILVSSELLVQVHCRAGVLQKHKGKFPFSPKPPDLSPTPKCKMSSPVQSVKKMHWSSDDVRDICLSN